MFCFHECHFLECFLWKSHFKCALPTTCKVHSQNNKDKVRMQIDVDTTGQISVKRP